MAQYPLPQNSAEYTFDTFVACGSNQTACNAAREIPSSESQSAAVSPCVFYNAATPEGVPEKRPHGIGVTHLLLATANALRAKGCRITWFSTEDYCREMTRAIEHRAADTFRAWLLTDSDCLILDNIELFEGKEATQELAVPVIEELAAAGKRTLMGCSGDIRTLPRFFGRLREGFPARRLIAVPPLDEEGQLKLMNRYCCELGLNPSEEEKRRMISSDARAMRGNLVTWKAKRELLG